MTKKEVLNYSITTWWWNMGTKKKDFVGTYKEWFKKNNIKVKSFRKDGGDKLSFKGEFGSMKISITMTDYDLTSLNKIIQFCLVYLGDKAMLHDGLNREYKINWR